ncbi:unnamed protein product [Pleuronectes platessa]|uniref:Uncharacterized protein n=1 Tax=Pleuronectes platessa TaxID=8262 RepID=A0A9N7YBE6_PLEPL|nr:unnamed protein product [Pleuronectes platessa]
MKGGPKKMETCAGAPVRQNYSWRGTDGGCADEINKNKRVSKGRRRVRGAWARALSIGDTQGDYNRGGLGQRRSEHPARVPPVSPGMPRHNGTIPQPAKRKHRREGKLGERARWPGDVREARRIETRMRKCKRNEFSSPIGRIRRNKRKKNSDSRGECKKDTAQSEKKATSERRRCDGARRADQTTAQEEGKGGREHGRAENSPRRSGGNMGREAAVRAENPATTRKRQEGPNHEGNG